MNIKRAVGMALSCVGTCTLMLVLMIMEVFRTLNHHSPYNLYTLTFGPIPFCFLIPIGWIIAGIVLIVCGKNRAK